MKSIGLAIQSFFIKHSVWTHLTMVLMLSYVLVQMSQLLSVKNFMGWVIGLSIISIPVYIFAIARTKYNLKEKKGYKIAWTAVFLVYPILLFFFDFDIKSLGFDYLYNLDIEGHDTYSFLAILYLIIETLNSLVTHGRSDRSSIKWLNRVSVFKLAAVITTFSCLFLMATNNYFQPYVKQDEFSMIIAKFCVLYAQLFIIYLSYYLYYYIHHHLLFKIILKEKGIVNYFIGLGMVIMLIIPIHNYIISLFPVVDILKLHPIGLMPELLSDFNYGLGIFVLLLSFPLIVVIEWYKQANAMNVLEREKSKSELSLLRQQINPHFFFNTLNNLYAMSLNEEEDTPETILQLSELMRYVIYKGKEEKVRLKDELKYMNDYIDLQMIRVHKEVDLKVDFDINNLELEIPPLLFIILLENAFKHGIEPAGRKSTLHISMDDKEGKLRFECTNSIEGNSDKKEKGIGLSNLKKRLQILYPENHTLTLIEEDNAYTSQLTIIL